MNRIFHPARPWPAPGIPLIVELEDGTHLEVIRPEYSASFQHDPNYRDLNDNHIKGVLKWAIK